LAAGEVREAGVWLPEQVASPERFFDALSVLGWKPVIEEAPSIAEAHEAGRSLRPEDARP